MNKRERFESFLANQPVDRVPIAFFHHFTERSEWLKGVERPDIFEKNIDGHRKSREIFDPDVIKVMNDSLMLMPVDLSEVKCAADLPKLKAPAPDSPFMQKTKELTLRALEFYKDSEAPKFVTGFSPAMVLKTAASRIPDGRKLDLVGFLREDPESFVKALDILAETIMGLNEMLIKECGAEGIYFSVNNQNNFFPQDLYRQYITPSDKKVIEHANSLSKINMLHICGFAGLTNDLELFKDYDCAAINWAVTIEGVSLKEGKKLFGGKPVFGGFPQTGVLDSGTREEVVTYTHKILDEAGSVGIMIAADCTVPTDLDDNRLEWVRQACIDYAKK